MDHAIQVRNLSYSFGDRKALDDVRFEVARGEVFGVLGPNGAGKTTTVRLLNGLYPPEPGQVTVWGFDPATQGTEVRRHTGVLTESPSLNELLSVEENLAFYGTLYGLSRQELSGKIDRALGELGLGDRRRDKAGTLSKGLKQRLAIARAILHDPPVLFFDEPTSGLDPESAGHVNELILTLKRQGRTVFLCTHRLTEAERVCDRYAFFSHGRLLACGTKPELERSLEAFQRVTLEFLGPPPEWPEVSGARPIATGETACTFEVANPQAVARLVRIAVELGAKLWKAVPSAPTLEELYFAVLKRKEGQA